MEKDARLRFWPANSAWFELGKFTYPARQRWFATQTQIGNEPAYVDGGDCLPRKIYYHSGNDIGGCEGLIDVVSACDGLVVSARGKAMDGYTNAPFHKPHGDYDYVYVLDEHGWFYRYAHLQSIHDSVQPGKKIKAGEKIGVLGKEGSRGGWVHLHFDVKALQPSGKWGIQDAYAFLWETPTLGIRAGDAVTFKVRTFRTAAGAEMWDFGDGSPRVEVQSDGNAKPLAKDGYAVTQHRYTKPGHYIARVERSNEREETAVARLAIEVGEPDKHWCPGRTIISAFFGRTTLINRNRSTFIFSPHRRAIGFEGSPLHTAFWRRTSQKMIIASSRTMQMFRCRSSLIFQSIDTPNRGVSARAAEWLLSNFSEAKTKFACRNLLPVAEAATLHGIFNTSYPSRRSANGTNWRCERSTHRCLLVHRWTNHGRKLHKKVEAPRLPNDLLIT